MRYYEITNMDHPQLSEKQTRVIDEDELDRRLSIIMTGNPHHGSMQYDHEQAKQILLHGNVKEAPDPWEEWAEGAADAIVGSEPRADWTHVKNALLNLKALVEKNTGCDSTPSKP